MWVVEASGVVAGWSVVQAGDVVAVGDVEVRSGQDVGGVEVELGGWEGLERVRL